MNILEFVEKNSVALTDHAKFADAKAGALLTLVASIGGGMSVAARPVVSAVHVAGGLGQVVVMVAGAATLAGAAGTTWFCLRAIAPRTWNAGSLSSFPDIAALARGEHAQRLRSLSADEMLDSYCHHNQVLAQIAQTKFNAVRLAVHCTYVTLLAVYVFMLAYGITLATSASATASGAT